jgi:dipeptidyl-peptidase-4
VLIQELNSTKNGVSKTFDASDLNQSLLADYPESDSIKYLPPFTWLESNVLRYYVQGSYFSYDLTNKRTTKICDFDRKDISHIKTHNKTLNQAYVKEHNLMVQAPNGNELVLTTDGMEGIVYGQGVHRFEFGITDGLFWSESGNSLAFYRMDEMRVTQYPLYDLDSKPAKAKNTFYPVAGDPSHKVTIGIYRMGSITPIYLKTGEPLEQYLTNIAWSPDEQFVYVAVVNREQDHMWLKKFDANTGEFVKTLFEETNEKYVEPEHPPVFLKKDPSKFLWWSERDGFDHIYLYDTSGKMLKQLTKGDWVVTDVYGTNSDETKLFISGTKESATERDLYCVDMKTGRMQKLTKDPGTHSITPSPGLKYFCDEFSNTVTPLEVRILDADGIPYEIVHKAENPITEYALGAMELGTIKAKDGTPLHYRLFKPINFDPNKKYPVIVYLYNGPHAQMVRNAWLGGANLWYQLLAQKGYLVFTIDGRGSANRGFAFESAIFRNVGELEMQDQLDGVNWLIGQGFADKDRMGIHGWSYGGFMTTSMMTRHPGVFKVGVAGGPVIDWAYYEIMYTERYMDTPLENPEGYEKTNLLNHAGDLQGKLLMIHGAQDATVLWQHSLMYLQKSIELGITDLDYYVYPHHEHNVRGKDRIHLYKKVTDYMLNELEK